MKEGIGVSCGYTYKLDLTCITTCYHHLVIKFYSLSISLKDLHVGTGLGLRDQVMCGIARTPLLRPDACALVPKLCRDYKQQLSVGDGGEGGSTRFKQYFHLFIILFYLQIAVGMHFHFNRFTDFSFSCFYVFGNHTHANTNSNNQNIWATNGW